jgi:hypothetical protein
MTEEVKRKLEAYYEEQEALILKEKQARKEKDLIARGLYKVEEKEVLNKFSGEKLKEQVKVALDIPDDEYEKVVQYEQNNNIKGPKVANLQLAFRVIGVITLIIGFFMGLIMADESFFAMLTIWLSVSIAGLLYLALAKGLDLLEEINRNTKSK